MRTIKECKNYIEELTKEHKELTIMDDNKKRKIIKKIKMVRKVIIYLETEPNEVTLKSQVANIKKIIKSKDEGFDYWLKNNCPPNITNDKKAKAWYNKENNIKELKEQINILSFILN